MPSHGTRARMLLLIKLTVTPILVGLMSLALRYWGPTAGSILIGLPWMTGPVVFILGQERGDPWVEQTCTGVQLGVIALCGYAAGYTVMARRCGWLASQLVGTAVFGIVAVVVQGLGLGAVVAPLGALAGLLLLYRAIVIPPEAPVPGRLPWWDIPARMLATAVLVVIISLTADKLGPTWSGIIATFPVIMTVIGTFTHAQWGGDATRRLFRGVVLSLVSFVLFFVAVEAWVVRLGLLPAYALAVVTSVATSATFLLLRRRGLIR